MIRKDITVEHINKNLNLNMTKHLGIEYTEIGKDYICGKMPVDERTRQPFGLLHGGASIVLAETLCSVGSNLIIDQEKQFCVGEEINANHIKSAKDGFVYGKSTIKHKGSRTHVWETNILNEEGALVCISRMTVAVLDKR